MKNWLTQFKHEDWVVVAVSILLLAMSVIIPSHLPQIPKQLTTWTDFSNAIQLFVIVLIIFYLGWIMLGRPLKGLIDRKSVV